MLQAELEMSQVAVSILTCHMLDEWKMCQVTVSILIVLQTMGNEPSCCQYLNVLRAELEMRQVVVSILTCYILDEWKMSQVTVSILIVLQAMGNEPSCCQYTNTLQAELEMRQVVVSTLTCCMLDE